jgi:hypothetical protein
MYHGRAAKSSVILDVNSRFKTLAEGVSIYKTLRLKTLSKRILKRLSLKGLRQVILRIRYRIIGR